MNEFNSNGNFSDKKTRSPIQVVVAGAFDFQILVAELKDGFIVHHETAITVFDGGMSTQKCIVRFDDTCGHSGRRINSKL